MRSREDGRGSASQWIRIVSETFNSTTFNLEITTKMRVRRRDLSRDRERSNENPWHDVVVVSNTLYYCAYTRNADMRVNIRRGPYICAYIYAYTYIYIYVYTDRGNRRIRHFQFCSHCRVVEVIQSHGENTLLCTIAIRGIRIVVYVHAREIGAPRARARARFFYAARLALRAKP